MSQNSNKTFLQLLRELRGWADKWKEILESEKAKSDTPNIAALQAEVRACEDLLKEKRKSLFNAVMAQDKEQWGDIYAHEKAARESGLGVRVFSFIDVGDPEDMGA